MRPVVALHTVDPGKVFGMRAGQAQMRGRQALLDAQQVDRRRSGGGAERLAVDLAAERNSIAGLFGDDMAPLLPNRAQVLENWTWHVDTKTGNVDYLREGERQFTDEDWRVVSSTSDAEWDVMLTRLLLARQKFGPRIDVTGGDDFRERTVMPAVEHRLDIRFGDAALEARRLSLVRLMQ